MHDFQFVNIIISLAPVFLFLGLLIYFDSFALVKKTLVALCVFWGIFSAFIALRINNQMAQLLLHTQFQDALLVAVPLIEEALKIIFVAFLIGHKKVGFLIDAAIYGFATGAGFSLAENLFYLIKIEESSASLWVIRGFGTAIMHGGSVAIFAVLFKGFRSQSQPFGFTLFLGYGIAVIIHTLFNWLTFNPILPTLAVLILVPLALIIIFQSNESAIRRWLEMEFDSEAKLLSMIRKGKFSDMPSGQYLISLKDSFDSIALVDILNYIYLHLELSIKAKSNIMLKEQGFDPIIHDGIEEQLLELKALKKSIGPIGLSTINPILRMSTKDLWKLKFVK